MDSRIRNILWFGVSTLIIAGLVYFADIDRFLEALRTANLLILAPAFVFGLAVFPVWAYTWYRIFLKSGVELSYRKALRIFMAGNFMNSITPLGQFGGEPVMAYLLQQNSDASYEKSISSILSADIINGIPMLTFILGGAAYLLLFPETQSQEALQRVIQVVYMVILVVGFGGTLVYLLWFRSGALEGWIIRIARKVSNLLGRGGKYVEMLENKFNDIEKSFEMIGDNPEYLLKTAVVAHIGFVFQVFCLFFIIWSMGFSPDFAPIYFVVTLSGLANFSPTPGGSGAFEFAMAGFITVFFPMIPYAVGLLIGILFRLTTYWPGLVLGYVALNSLENGGSK